VSFVDEFYKGNYKRYLILPAFLFLVLAFLAFVFPGISLGIDLQGGNMLVVGTERAINSQELEEALLRQFNLSEVRVIPFQGGVQVQYDFVSPDENAHSMVEGVVLEYAGIGLEEQDRIQRTKVSPALGSIFWSNALWVLSISLIAVIIVIFAFFREIVPSLAVVLAAAFDILAALALMSIFEVKLSLASISALLMLVGYSVDTDIMLTTRLFRRRSAELVHAASESMKTGLTMTFTSMGAVAVMLFLSWIWQMDLIFAISAVLLFGLLGDLVSTWFMNAPILIVYLERKERKKR